ncbi:hypothetical protein LBAT_0256 [Lactobacillus acetotolerans]|uniref:HTH-like domain-containing protein n=2 Tax=Lactobacillus acetotolerans TaxID=1600 RepID=A0A0D6A2A6_9LACO|nr:hypothetical protein LBAT_0256 [Lactobacillus acetotolerans]
MIKHYHPAFGYWTVTDDLRVKWHLKINHKRVYRLMQANHLSAKVYKTCGQANMILLRARKARKPKTGYTAGS